MVGKISDDREEILAVLNVLKRPPKDQSEMISMMLKFRSEGITKSLEKGEKRSRNSPY